MRGISITGALAVGLAACAVGPNYRRPATPNPASYTATAEPAVTAGGADSLSARQSFRYGGPIDAQWWRSLGSPELDVLVETALANNADVRAAAAALRGATETYRAQGGQVFPSVGLQGQGSRSRSSASLSPPLSIGALTYNLFNAQLNVGYTLDLFGGVRRSIEASRAQAEQQRFQSEATYLTLIGNLVNAYVQLASLEEQLGLTQSLVDADREVVRLTELQRRQGQVSGAELALAQNAFAQAENSLPGLRKQIAQQRDLIAALSGRTPSELGALRPDLNEMRLPAELPVSVPAALVDQRPDIRSAEAGVHTAAAQLGVAIANRLPALTLTGTAGGTSTRFVDLLSRGNEIWSITGALAQPVFEGGTLLHRQRAAKAALDQAKAQYRSTLLTAFQNVADVLSAINADAGALSASETAEGAATRSYTIARAQNRFGQTSGLPALNAQATRLQAQIAVRQGQAARLTDSVALFVALGGGWWERSDFPQTRSATLAQ